MTFYCSKYSGRHVLCSRERNNTITPAKYDSREAPEHKYYRRNARRIHLSLFVPTNDENEIVSCLTGECHKRHRQFKRHSPTNLHINSTKRLNKAKMQLASTRWEIPRHLPHQSFLQPGAQLFPSSSTTNGGVLSIPMRQSSLSSRHLPHHESKPSTV